MNVAQRCAVLPLTAQGVLRATSVVHRDPAKAAILEKLGAIDIPPDSPPLQAALAESATRLVTDISTIMPGGTRAARVVTGILQCARLDSVVILPLRIAQRASGVVMLGRDMDSPRFTNTDIAIIDELARRLAAGLAETFAREHTVAETLQRALLPDAPPRSWAWTWPCGTCPPLTG
jgi:phosphoserine phosphatase RsbU/P